MVSKQVRDSSVKRGDIKDTVRLAVWARAAGCCVMCSTTLLGGGLLRGATALASQRQTADALLTDGYLGLVDSRWQGDFLCKIAGDPSRTTYWAAAQEEIDHTLHLVEQAVASGEVEHLSIF